MKTSDKCTPWKVIDDSIHSFNFGGGLGVYFFRYGEETQNWNGFVFIQLGSRAAVGLCFSSSVKVFSRSRIRISRDALYKSICMCQVLMKTLRLCLHLPDRKGANTPQLASNQTHLSIGTTNHIQRIRFSLYSLLRELGFSIFALGFCVSGKAMGRYSAWYRFTGHTWAGKNA